jgi:hypothetical protein
MLKQVEPAISPQVCIIENIRYPFNRCIARPRKLASEHLKPMREISMTLNACKARNSDDSWSTPVTPPHHHLTGTDQRRYCIDRDQGRIGC